MITLPPGGILTKLDLLDEPEEFERHSLDGEDIKLVSCFGVFKMGCTGDESGVPRSLTSTEPLKESLKVLKSHFLGVKSLKSIQVVSLGPGIIRLFLTQEPFLSRNFVADLRKIHQR